MGERSEAYEDLGGRIPSEISHESELALVRMDFASESMRKRVAKYEKEEEKRKAIESEEVTSLWVSDMQQAEDEKKRQYARDTIFDPMLLEKELNLIEARILAREDKKRREREATN